MSAKLDRSQDIRFFYGNAARDLAKSFPDFAEAAQAVAPAASKEHIHASVDFGPRVSPFTSRESGANAVATEAEMIAQAIDRCLELGEQLSQKQRLLGFLMADLKRMIG